MGSYSVQITGKALADMEEIYIYIAVQLLSPDTALALYNRIANSIETLSKLPERIRLLESEPEHSQGIRQFAVENFAVFFVIRNKTVTILRVLYGASDINRKLLDIN